MLGHFARASSRIFRWVPCLSFRILATNPRMRSVGALRAGLGTTPSTPGKSSRRDNRSRVIRRLAEAVSNEFCREKYLQWIRSRDSESERAAGRRHNLAYFNYYNSSVMRLRKLVFTFSSVISSLRIFTSSETRFLGNFSIDSPRALT